MSGGVSSTSHNEFIGDPETALAAAKRARKAVLDRGERLHKEETELKIRNLQERKEVARRSASNPKRVSEDAEVAHPPFQNRDEFEDEGFLPPPPAYVPYHPPGPPSARGMELDAEHVRQGHEAIRAFWDLPDAEREQLQRERASGSWAPALWQAVREGFSGLNCPPSLEAKILRKMVKLRRRMILREQSKPAWKTRRLQKPRWPS
jgi:hypothetical protein